MPRLDHSTHNKNRYQSWLNLVALLLATILVYTASPATAQELVWREQRTTNVAILYPEGAEAEAQQYAQFADSVYDEISGVFGYRTPPPVVLRIYPSMDLYYEANPLAEQLAGVVAHAHTGRREISIALPQTVGQSEEQIVNNVRHELAHIIATDLSDNKLTVAFQEGIAQFVEHPTPELDAKMQLLRRAIDQGRLMPWTMINQPKAPYNDPLISYPQSYSMVAFLVQRNGFATLRGFIEASKTSNGYRSALESTYGVSADRLEQEWLAQINAFVDGGYRQQIVTTFDSAHAEALIARGEYAEAVRELETIQAGLAPDAAEAIKVEEMLIRARNGQRAIELAAEARNALTLGEYEQAKQAAETAQPLLASLGQGAQANTLSEYVRLANDGLRAEQELDLARQALRTLRVNTARAALVNAYTTFAQLGDQDGIAAAQRSLSVLDRAQWFFVIGLLLLAAVTLGWNIHRRVSERTPVVPFS